MSLKDKLRTLPSRPGCYLMKDETGKVIYVGKAISLKNRVNSYFVGAHDYKTTKLVSNIRDFDFIVVNNEKEALILEYNLIKKYDPYFNIVFKDDKSYPYILLKDSIEPAVSVVRLKKNSKYKGKLFGPYPDVGAARNLVKVIGKLFPIRKCENGGRDLCLYYHIGECLGYCRNKIDKEVCDSYKNKILAMLAGDTSDVLNDLNEKMKECSMNLEFEKASEYRDLIADIKTATIRQSVQVAHKENFDIFGYYSEDGYIAITGLFVRDGKLLGSDKHIDYLVGDVENYVTSYLYQYYMINPAPKYVLVPKELLSYLEGSGDVNYRFISRGPKYQLIQKAITNCKENLKQNRKIITSKEAYDQEISGELKRIFNKDIRRIELFDNSHTAGTETVAGLVVYKDNRPSRKDYRLFKLEDSADDFASMKEALYRRYFRVLKEDLERPDLLIVDGAKTQIKAAREILDALGMDITIAGLGKDDHHNTSYLMDSDLNIIDIKNDSNLFFFLTNMQDEVHRFAITYHKKRRQKAVYKSLLDDVEGLGPKSRMKLLRKYHSIAKIRELPLEELETVLTKNTALRLYNKLKEEKENA